jgi:Na+/phosphate symporter
LEFVPHRDGRYRPLLFVIGWLISLAIAAALVRRRRASCATSRVYRRLRGDWITGALVAFALTYGLGRFVVAPLFERL